MCARWHRGYAYQPDTDFTHKLLRVAVDSVYD